MATIERLTAIQTEIERIAPEGWSVTLEHPGYLEVVFTDENGLTARYAAGLDGGVLVVNSVPEDGTEGLAFAHVPDHLSPLMLAIHIIAGIDDMERA